MQLLATNIYYVLNDRTTKLFMKGDVDLSVAVGEEGAATSISDAEAEAILKIETEVDIFVVDKNRAGAGGAFFKYLNVTNFDLARYGVLKSIDRNNYKHNCLYLALEAGCLSDVKLQQLVLTVRNRTICTCDLSNVCNVLEINIEISSLRNDNEKSRVEHYPQYPFVEYDEHII